MANQHLAHTHTQEHYDYHECEVDRVPERVSDPAVIARINDHYRRLPEWIEELVFTTILLDDLLFVVIVIVTINDLHTLMIEDHHHGNTPTHITEALSSRTVHTAFLCVEVDLSHIKY